MGRRVCRGRKWWWRMEGWMWKARYMWLVVVVVVEVQVLVAWAVLRRRLWIRPTRRRAS